MTGEGSPNTEVLVPDTIIDLGNLPDDLKEKFSENSDLPDLSMAYLRAERDRTREREALRLQEDPYPMDYLEGRIIDENSTL